LIAKLEVGHTIIVLSASGDEDGLVVESDPCDEGICHPDRPAPTLQIPAHFTGSARGRHIEREDCDSG